MESSFLLICSFNCQKEAKALQFCAYALETQDSTVSTAALTSILIWIKKKNAYTSTEMSVMWTNKQTKKQDQLLRCFCPHWVFPAPRWRWRCCILLGWRGMPSPSVVPREGLSSPVSGDQSQAFSAVWKAQPFEGGPGGKQGQTRGLRKSRVMFLLYCFITLFQAVGVCIHWNV